MRAALKARRAPRGHHASGGDRKEAKSRRTSLNMCCKRSDPTLYLQYHTHEARVRSTAKKRTDKFLPSKLVHFTEFGQQGQLTIFT